MAHCLHSPFSPHFEHHRQHHDHNRGHKTKSTNMPVNMLPKTPNQNKYPSLYAKPHANATTQVYQLLSSKFNPSLNNATVKASPSPHLLSLHQLNSSTAYTNSSSTPASPLSSPSSSSSNSWSSSYQAARTWFPSSSPPTKLCRYQST